MVQTQAAPAQHQPYILDQAAQITRILLPLMERTGVATAEDVDVETLAARLRQEALKHNAVIVSPVLIGAWTQKR